MADLPTTFKPEELAGIPRIGTDESGKGDYFGDLVIAGVYLGTSGESRARELGVRDSKQLSDAQARAIARAVRHDFPFEIVRISPDTYNDLYEKMGNLNRLLAWAHARVIENLQPRTNARLAVADQFGNTAILENALMRAGRHIRLLQIPRGERDTAVAAASVLARAEFLRRLDQLSHELGITLPKGANQVITAGREIYHSGGMSLLRHVAKLHFKTTTEIIGD